MKFTTDSKGFAEIINTVVGTTGASEVNFEIGKAGMLLVKADVKGTSHHERTDVVVEEGEQDEKATVKVDSFLGLINKRGEVSIEINDKGNMFIKAKSYKAELNLSPTIDIDDIENSKQTMELRGVTVDSLKTHLSGLSITNLFTETQPFVMVRCKDELLELLCMDSVHGVRYKIPVTNQADFSFTVSYDALTKLIGLIMSNPEAVFAVEESRIFVQSDRCSISFPKTQTAASKIDFGVVETLHKKCLKSAKTASHLKGINLESMIQEISACKHIAYETNKLSIYGNSKNTGYVVDYATNLGKILKSNKCETHWVSDDQIQIIPFLLLDFLESLSLFESINLSYKDKMLFSNIATGDGYEAFHVCSCG